MPECAECGSVPADRVCLRKACRLPLCHTCVGHVHGQNTIDRIKQSELTDPRNCKAYKQGGCGICKDILPDSLMLVCSECGQRVCTRKGKSTDPNRKVRGTDTYVMCYAFTQKGQRLCNQCLTCDCCQGETTTPKECELCEHRTCHTCRVGKNHCICHYICALCGHSDMMTRMMECLTCQLTWCRECNPTTMCMDCVIEKP